MSSYLLGVGRNHSVAYTDSLTNWQESKLRSKIHAYRDQIPAANISQSGGKHLYRIGHNPTDGNFGYDNNGHDVNDPGWHWATDYKSEGAEHEVQTMPSEATRIGAGVHRYFFRDPTAGSNLYYGYAVTNNYPNDVGNLLFSTKASQPKSKMIRITGSTHTLTAADLPKPSGFSSTDYYVNQIGGPTIDNAIPPGCYEIDFRIVKKSNNHVGYLGYVISITKDNSGRKIISIGGDVIDVINTTAGGSESSPEAVLLNNSKMQTIELPMIVQSTSTLQEDVVYQPSIRSSNSHFDAQNFKAFGYDRFVHAMEEAMEMNADLAVVVNVATGYPEEAVGLLRYLNVMNINTNSNTKIAYVELGNELMGTWNKGVLSVYNQINGGFDANTSFQHPTGLGKTIRPFANMIKNDPVVKYTKVAATSAYNLFFAFTHGSSTPANNISLFVTELKSGSTCYVDFINFHNYPGNLTSILPFDPTIDPDADCHPTSSGNPADRYRNLGGMNEYFNVNILQHIRSATPSTLRTVPDANGQTTTVGIVMSEGNANSVPRCSQDVKVLQNSLVEGLYFAESFMSAAKNGFHALTNFAFVRPVIYQSSDDVKNPPTKDGTYFDKSENFDLHFYPNSGLINQFYTSVYTKPTFKVKSMIAKNLGKKVLEEPTYTSMTTTALVNVSYSAPQNFTYNNFGILATQSDTDPNELRLLIINRNLPGTNNVVTTSPLQFVFTGRTIASSELMFMAGKKIIDTEPVTDLSNTTILDPMFKSVPVPSDGVFNIPKYAVCILKIKLAPNTSCTAPTLSCKTTTTTVTKPQTGSLAVIESMVLNTTGNSYGSGTNCEGSTTFNPAALSTVGLQTVTVTRTNSAGLATNCTAQVQVVESPDPCLNLLNVVSIVTTANSILVTGLKAPVVKLKLYNSAGTLLSSYSTTYTNCDGTTPCTHTFSSLSPGQYTVEVKYQSGAYVDICPIRQQVVTVGGTPAVPSLSISSKTVNETASTVTLTVSASGITSNTMTVNYATSNGTATAGSDYTAKNGTLTFIPGATSMDIVISILDNTVGESSETFNVTLSAPTNSTIATSTGVVTILDNDSAPNCTNFTIATTSNSITVGNLSAPIVKVKLFNSAFSQLQSCTTPNCGLPATTFTGLSAGQYYVEVKYHNADWTTICTSALTSVVIGSIPPSTPVLSISDVTVNENGGTATLTATLTPSATSIVTVGYGTSNGSAAQPSDYTFTSGTLTFTAGQTSKTITVPIIDDTTPETIMQFTVALSNATNATLGDGTGVVTILDNDNPNLKVTYVTNPIISGTTLCYKYKVETLGGNVSQPYTVRLYRSTNATLETATDSVLHTSTISMSSVGNITSSTFCVANQTNTGTWYLVKVDADNVVTESLENDNIAAYQMPQSLMAPTPSNPTVAAEPKATTGGTDLYASDTDHALFEAVIKVYPNPTETLLNIEWESALQSLMVFDISGRLMTDLSGGIAQLTSLQLDCSNWSSGLYVLKGRNQSQVFTKKFLVQHSSRN